MSIFAETISFSVHCGAMVILFAGNVSFRVVQARFALIVNSIVLSKNSLNFHSEAVSEMKRSNKQVSRRTLQSTEDEKKLFSLSI